MKKDSHDVRGLGSGSKTQHINEQNKIVKRGEFEICYYQDGHETRFAVSVKHVPTGIFVSKPAASKAEYGAVLDDLFADINKLINDKKKLAGVKNVHKVKWIASKPQL